MYCDNRIQKYAESYMSALKVDLPDISFKNKNMEDCTRRPDDRDVKVISFEERWGSTSLGFGGMGGAAMTCALTVLVICKETAAVYWHGELAYTLPSKYVQEFINDLRTPNRKEAIKNYEADFPDKDRWIKAWENL